MDDVSEIINLRTGAVVRHENFVVQKTREYPHDWFDKHPQQKPKIELPRNNSNIVDLIRRMQNMDMSEFTPKLACLIPSKYFQKLNVTLEESWVSKGITIGMAGSEITPLNLFDIQEKDKEVDGLVSNDPVDEDAFVGALLLIYRLNQLPSGNIVGRLSQRCQTLFNSKPPFSFTDVPISLGHWDSDLIYRKLVAGLDMFLEKFPTHPKGKLKFGTLSSKWRDCSALKTLYEVHPTLGFKYLDELTPRFWEESIRTDAWRVLPRPLNLGSDGVSYFFYMADFGLVTKSVYSAAVNPALHVFCQVIHCAAGNPRGINARMLFPNQVRAVVRNALMVAFALDKSTPRGIELVPTREREKYSAFFEQRDRKRTWIEQTEDEDDEDAPEDPMPKSREPQTWFAYFETIEDTMPLK